MIIVFLDWKKLFVLSGRVLDSFTSYLKDRQGVLSLLFGDSQIGPALFAVYTNRLGIIAQLFGSLDPGNKSDVSFSLENLDHCTADIQLRATSDVLKLSEGKTNIIYIWLHHTIAGL